MPILIRMPVFSSPNDGARLSRWAVKEGDAVAAGDVLAEAEIDKTTVEIEAGEDGRVGAILTPEGEAPLPGGAPLAWLLAPGEDTNAIDGAAIEPDTLPDTSADHEPVSIVSDDYTRAAYDATRYDFIPHSRMRRTVAARLTEAKSTIPHFYISMDCRIDAALELRRKINNLPSTDGEVRGRVSLNDFLVKALAAALIRVPSANASWTADGILAHKQADIGIAVAVDGGLYTPILRNAEAMALRDLSLQVRRLTERARRGVLSPDDYRGGSSTVSNLGMFPVRRFTAIINPPQATILAVGQGEKRPVIRRGEMTPATILSVTLSCDHRVVDGAVGAQLLAAFKNLIEDHPEDLV